MIYRRLFLLFLPVMFIAGCHSNRLETAYRLAGDNEGELRKVIEHYSESEADSQKLRAAIFLIENMPGHVSADSARLAPFYDSVNRLLDVRFKMQGNRDSIIKFVESQTYYDSMAVRDIEAVTGDFLIRHIDYSFDVWGKPWNRHLSLEEFCEYILPYKYAEYQRLDYWKDSLYKKFHTAVDKILPNDAEYNYSYKIGHSVNREFLSKLKPIIVFKEHKLGPVSPFYNSVAVPRISFGDCNDYAIVNVAAMRSVGVPAVFEYTPQWGEKASGRHGWSSVCNNNGFVPIPHTDKNVGEVFFPTRKLPKIFRYQYAAVPEREEYVKNAKYVHYEFTQFEKDVTAEYVRASDVSVPVRTKGLADKKYAYIAVSNFREWNVVDFGVIKNNKAVFKNLGRDIAYLVYGFDGEELVPISDPFILAGNGEVLHLNADYGSLQDSVTLWRKYPRSENTANMENRIMGGRIQASNDSLFEVCTTFYEIKDLRYPDLIPLESDTLYRYWRYFAVPGSFGTIAEFQLFRDGVDSMLMGKIYGTTGRYNNNTAHSNAFDNDWLTYHQSTNLVSDVWIAMDFGEPVTVDRARCVPRSDDNAIHYGDTYELTYFADGEWVSRGEQIARKRFLLYDSVPRNSLLLLKNTSRGREERIFTYENGEQRWW